MSAAMAGGGGNNEDSKHRDSAGGASAGAGASSAGGGGPSAAAGGGAVAGVRELEERYADAHRRLRDALGKDSDRLGAARAEDAAREQLRAKLRAAGLKEPEVTDHMARVRAALGVSAVGEDSDEGGDTRLNVDDSSGQSSGSEDEDGHSSRRALSTFATESRARSKEIVRYFFDQFHGSGCRTLRAFCEQRQWAHKALRNDALPLCDAVDAMCQGSSLRALLRTPAVATLLRRVALLSMVDGMGGTARAWAAVDYLQDSNADWVPPSVRQKALTAMAQLSRAAASANDSVAAGSGVGDDGGRGIRSRSRRTRRRRAEAGGGSAERASSPRRQAVAGGRRGGGRGRRGGGGGRRAAPSGKESGQAGSNKKSGGGPGGPAASR
jgi:hypothetical protein